MAIRRIFNISYKGITLQSGNLYDFQKYLRFENDPSPTVIFLYVNRGMHPNTGHYHNYFTCVNLAYIPKKLRRSFIRRHINRFWNPRTQEAKRGMRVDYEDIESYLKVALRRYLINYVVNPKDIPFSALDAVLIDLKRKDYWAKATYDRAKRLVQRPLYRVTKKKKKRPAPTPPKRKVKARKLAKGREGRQRRGR